MNTVVIVSHPGIGSALSKTALTILTSLPCKIITIDCPPDADTDTLRSNLIKQLKGVEGEVIFFSDVFGATPHHLAASIASNIAQKSVLISGINLPMLLRTINYINLPLDILHDKAIHGGQDGIQKIDTSEA